MYVLLQTCFNHAGPKQQTRYHKLCVCVCVSASFVKPEVGELRDKGKYSSSIGKEKKLKEHML